MITFISWSPEQTELIGERIGSLLSAGMVIGLDGPLGGGKTALAKALIKGVIDLDPDSVTSPAFSLVNEYNAEGHSLTVYHMDFYRLDSLTNEDFEMFSEYLNDENGIVIAEWGSRFLPELSKEYIQIELTYIEEGPDESRLIRINSCGGSDRYNYLLENIQDYVNNHS